MGWQACQQPRAETLPGALVGRGRRGHGRGRTFIRSIGLLAAARLEALECGDAICMCASGVMPAVVIGGGSPCPGPGRINTPAGI